VRGKCRFFSSASLNRVSVTLALVASVGSLTSFRDDEQVQEQKTDSVEALENCGCVDVAGILRLRLKMTASYLMSVAVCVENGCQKPIVAMTGVYR
jgi:hypothetical protein